MFILDPGPRTEPRQIEEIEKAIGRALPSSLSDFLLRYNGGHPTPRTFDVPDHEEHTFDVQVLYGVSRPIASSNIGWAYKTSLHVLGPERIAFGCTDTDDQLILDLRDGSVWFWDFQERDPLRRFYYVASSHSEFLTSLHGED